MQNPRDRAEVTTSADDDAGADAVVDDPLAVGAADVGDRVTVATPRARSMQQVVIEFASANAVTDDVVVGGGHVLRPSDDTGSKSTNRLQRPARAVFVEIELEIGDCLRGDPARTHLVAWKHRLVDHQHVSAGLSQPARARGTAWSAADDQHITMVHRISVQSLRLEPTEAGPRNGIAAAAREHHLKELHRTGAKR